MKPPRVLLQAMAAIAMVSMPMGVVARAEEPARPIDWSGLYLGASLGYAFGSVDHNFPAGSGGGGAPGLWAPDSTGGSAAVSGNGGLYGLVGGHTQQWGALVGGVELSFDIPDFNAHGSDIFGGLVGGTGYNAKVKWLATLTPRLGYAWDNFQVYGKGGVAMARLASQLTAGPAACNQPSTTINGNCGATIEQTHLGFTVGTGLAYAFAENWVAGLEYDYYDLGTTHYGDLTQPATFWALAYTLHPQIHALRARLTYRFGGTSAREPEPPPPAASGASRTEPWTGFTLGAHVGYGRAAFGHSFLPHANGTGIAGVPITAGLFAPDGTGGSFTGNGGGVLGGLHAGYDRQWDSVVAGIELALAFTDMKSRDSDVFGVQTLPTAVYEANVKWLATLAPRVGWAWDRTMLYGKAGLAVARVASTLGSSSATGCFAAGFGTQGPCTFNDDHIHIGLVAGVGVEYLVSDRWRLGLEYNYVDLGPEIYGGNTSPNSTWPVSYSVHPQLHLAKARASYQF